MARIYYSMAGEGRGHAVRVRSVVEELRKEHKLVLYAPDEAHEFLAPRYQGTEVEVRTMPCLRFHYSAKKLDYWKTTRRGVKFLWGFRRLVSDLAATLKAEKPDLVITDFEPALPRAARQAGVPFLSLDHQHFLVVSDLSALPWSLRWYADYMAFVVKRYHQGAEALIVSSFFFPPLKPRYRDAIQVGTMLRPEVHQVAKRTGDHIVTYLRGRASRHVVELLAKLERPVHIFGIGEQQPIGNARFFAIDEQKFLEDLASAYAVIGAAGNQTLGESLFLGKPVFALPEAKHHEQLLNAHFLRMGGGGDFVTLEAVTHADLESFLRRCDAYRDAIAPERLNGTPAAVAAIKRFLP